MNVIKVEGENDAHKVFIYALTTCGWCKKTKEFFAKNGVAYQYVDIDKATIDEKREIGTRLQELNVPLGFPVTVIDDETVISGYKPDDFTEALGL